MSDSKTNLETSCEPIEAIDRDQLRCMKKRLSEATRAHDRSYMKDFPSSFFGIDDKVWPKQIRAIAVRLKELCSTDGADVSIDACEEFVLQDVGRFTDGFTNGLLSGVKGLR